MTRELGTLLKWRWLRVLQIWNHLPIRAQGGITVLIPFVALLISFCFAIYGNQRRTSIATDIQRKFQVVKFYNDLLTLVVDAETGMRGFILTDRPEYLAPYQEAVDQIPQTINQIEQTIENEPGEKPRVERTEELARVQELVNQQLALLNDSQNFNDNQDREQLYEQLQREKFLMDEIRIMIGTMQNKEQTLLSERVAEINLIRNRDYIIIFVTLLIGMITRVISFYLFDRGIVRRVNRLTEYIRSINKGKPTHLIHSKKTDAVGMLENEVIELTQIIESRARHAKTSSEVL